HAMALNGRARGLQIQVRPPDRFINNPDEAVFATIFEYVPLDRSKLNQVDCALALIGDRDRIAAEFLPEGIVTSDEVVDPDPGMEVALVNQRAQANQTKGVIGEIVSVIAQPRFDFSFGSFDFENLVLIESKDERQPFAQPGDSGALVASGGKATAIVM